MNKWVGALCAMLVMIPTHAAAQTVSAHTPKQLADLVLDRFTSRDAAAFDSIVPDGNARQLVGWATELDWKLESASAGVVREDASSALIWVSGYPVAGNSGHETVLSQLFSGFYQAEQRDGAWRVVQKVPIDLGNRITSHVLTVDLMPGAGLRVTDTMRASVAGGAGLWLNVNRLVALETVSVDGQPAAHRLHGGLLHVSADDGTHEVVLRYALDIARDGDSNGNFSHFGAEFGHARSQHYWHPTLDGASGNDVADFLLTLRAPAHVRVVTSIPQSDTVIGDVLHVTARSVRPTSSLSLFYDAAWRPTVVRLGSIRADVFIGDSFEPDRATLESALQRVHTELSARYGEPATGYQAIVQVRGASSYGWHFRSNDVIGSGHRGGALSRGDAAPAHFIGHEMAHSWTNPTGVARLFLIEGWARFAESDLIRAEYGEQAERVFWERQRKGYLAGEHEGVNSLAGDAFNNGVSYEKGAWVLRMLRDLVGVPAFEAGMRAFVAEPAEMQDVATFARLMSRASGHDVAGFLHPWLHEVRIPVLDVRADGDTVRITQAGPVHVLPIELEIETDAGVERRRVLLTERSASVAVGRAILGVVADPDNRLLVSITPRQ